MGPGGYAYISVWKTLTLQTVAHEALEEAAGKTMPEFGMNPLRLKAKNAVEDLAEAAGLQIEKEIVIDYPFKMGSARDAADGGTILAGEMLKKLESDGDAGATTRFYEAFEMITQARGWHTGDEVEIP